MGHAPNPELSLVCRHKKLPSSTICGGGVGDPQNNSLLVSLLERLLHFGKFIGRVLSRAAVAGDIAETQVNRPGSCDNDKVIIL